MPRRILHVIDHTGDGGAQVVLASLARTLPESYAFVVAVLGEEGQFSEIYRSLGIPVFGLGKSGRHWDPSPLRSLVDLIQRAHCDLVHTHLFKSTVLGTLAARWTGRKSIVHDHTGVYPQPLLELYFSNALLRWSYLWLHQQILYATDHVCVLTAQDEESYLSSYSIDSGKITVLPNGIDMQKFRPAVRPRRERREGGEGSLRQELCIGTDTRVVMMIGRLHPMKDWLSFLKVAEHVQQLHDPDCAFVCVGSGPEEETLREYIRDHNLHNVFLIGYREDIPALLQQADLFLLTSRYEPFGIVVLEAMASGCPVVATRSAGPKTIVTHGKDGLLADVGDVDGLAVQVLRLLHNPELCRSIAQHAQQTITERYSIQSMGAQIANLYHKMLGQDCKVRGREDPGWRYAER